MGKKRRSAKEIVIEIINCLNENDGLMTVGELCKKVGINTETANHWLEIGFLFRNKCPFFNRQKVGKIGVIKIIKKSR